MPRRRVLTPRANIRASSTVSTPLTLDLILEMRRYTEMHRMYSSEKALNNLIKEMNENHQLSILRRDLSAEALDVIDMIEAKARA